MDQGGQVTGLIDRVRLVSRFRLRCVLCQLQGVLDIYERELSATGTSIPVAESEVESVERGPSRTQRLAGQVRALPSGVRPAWEDITAKIPERVKRRG